MKRIILLLIMSIGLTTAAHAARIDGESTVLTMEPKWTKKAKTFCSQKPEFAGLGTFQDTYPPGTSPNIIAGSRTV